MNNNKIILDLCGGTGSWSKPYKEAGYDVRVITLPKYDVLETELGSDYIYFRNANRTDVMLVPYHNIYGIFAAPTCTMFSLARTTAKTPRDFSEGMKLVKKCLEVIWKCRTSGNLKFWALENPVGYLRQFLGKPALTFNPCDYGDTYTKKTDIWGYFNAPEKKPVILNVEQLAKCAVNNRDLPALPEGYKPPDGRLQAARRAMTSKGFAEAFYKANK